MSARLDGVGATERQTLPIPYGHHVYVVSDLSLSPTTDATSRPVREFVDLLGDIDDAAVIIVAGNLFHPDADVGLREVRRRHARDGARAGRGDPLVLRARRATGSSCCPAATTTSCARNDAAQARLGAIGRHARQATSSSRSPRPTACATSRVAAGDCAVDVERADTDDRADADRLEDPPSLARFVAVAGPLPPPRRLGVAAGRSPCSASTCSTRSPRSISHFTHHHYRVHAPHTTQLLGQPALRTS